MTTENNYKCSQCNSENTETIFNFQDVPVLCCQLWEDTETAKNAPLGDMILSLCKNCGLIINSSFDENLMQYTAGYDNALHFSPRFREYAEKLGARLVRDYDLKDKKVAEIGCGDGYFMDLMVRHGAASGIGFDPSIKGMEEKTEEYTKSGKVRIITEYFQAENLPHEFDAITCRHVLEHLPDPAAFLKDVRQTIGDKDCVLYFEVPNAQWLLETNSIWDVIYEHITYWTAPAIRTLFLRAGFEPVKISTGYNDQFLRIEARPGKGDPEATPTAEEMEALVSVGRSFNEAKARQVSTWEAKLKELADKGEKAVIWGAGAKGITFMAVLEHVEQSIAALVDISYRKRGKYAPKVALPVVHVDDLKEVKPALVLIANKIYYDEIKKTLADIGLTPELDVITG